MPDRRSLISVVAPAVAADLRNAPLAARKLGFSGLQIPLNWAGTDLSKLSGTGLRDVARLLSAQDQQLVSISADLGTKGFSPGADVDRVLKELEGAMHAARSLAAGVVCIDLGPLPQPAMAEKPTPKVTQAMAGLILLPESVTSTAKPSASVPATADPAFFSQIDGALIELGRRADRFGVALAFRSDLSSFAALERALKAAACPWFGVDLDPVALLRDEWEMDKVFSRLGGLIRHVRARDAVGGTAGRTRPAPIGAGDTVWPEFLARLVEAAYQGWLTVDPTELPDRASAARAAIDVLRKAR
jgi:sugar phosphate isomerase/epimerase